MDYLPKVEAKDYNVKIDARNFFDQPINNSIKTFKNIRKNATVQGDDYTAGRLLDHYCYKENYQMIAIDLGKQQALKADPKAIYKINFFWKYKYSRKYNNVFHYWRRKRKGFELFKRNCKSILNILYNN